jgi:hypothetical protein
MAWTTSGVFRVFVANQLDGTAPMDLDAPTDVYKKALFGTLTPDKDVAQATSAYNTGVWLTSAEVTDATNWVAGGRAIANLAVTTPSTGVVMVDHDDVVGGGTLTLTAFFGSLTYNDTKTPKRGVSFNYFGGTQTVTGGTFTDIINANGLFRATV